MSDSLALVSKIRARITATISPIPRHFEVKDKIKQFAAESEDDDVLEDAESGKEVRQRIPLRLSMAMSAAAIFQRQSWCYT